MKLKLYSGDIQFPLNLNTQERMIFAQKIIDDNPESFTQSGYDKADNKVRVRLDILATYILNAEKDIRENVMSRYKEKRRPFQEKPISCLSKRSQRDINSQLYSKSYSISN